MLYKHTQIGYVLVSVMIAAAGVAFLANALLMVFLLGAIAVLFSTLTVSVDAENVSLWFGPGFLRKQFSAIDIESCQISKQRCWPLGIWGRPGKWWHFNVSGSHSVEIQMRNGLRYYVGSDRPEDLEKAIREAMHEARHLATKMV